MNNCYKIHLEHSGGTNSYVIICVQCQIIHKHYYLMKTYPEKLLIGLRA